jgi:hypothetical protein
MSTTALATTLKRPRRGKATAAETEQRRLVKSGNETIEALHVLGISVRLDGDTVYVKPVAKVTDSVARIITSSKPMLLAALAERATLPAK